MNKFAQAVYNYELWWSGLKEEVWRIPGLIQYYWQEHTFGVVVIFGLFAILLIVTYRRGYKDGNYAKMLDKIDEMFQKTLTEYNEMIEKSMKEDK